MGAQSGIQECKRQFALEKWNCPENTLSLSPHNGMRSGKNSFWIKSMATKISVVVRFFDSNLDAPVRKVLFTHKTRTHQLRINRAKLDIQVKSSGFLCLLFILATRETSFVHAISAAGVMYTLTKNCTAGDFDNCGCDDSKIGQPGKHVSNEHSIRGYSKRFLNWLVFLQRNNVMCYFVSGGVGWIWGGCSDNVAFGEKISKQFVDALEDGHDSRAAVNLHNNKAGRLVRFDLNIIDGFFMSIVF